MVGVKSRQEARIDAGAERDSHVPLADWYPSAIPQDDHSHVSDDERSYDERSIAADSWSVKSEYGSTLDGDDTRHAEVMEVMVTVADRTANGGCSEDEGEGDEEEGSVLGLRSHWDQTYADELSNFHESGQPGEIWFGDSVLEISAEWIARMAALSGNLSDSNSEGSSPSPDGGSTSAPLCGQAVNWHVLDLGMGNGLLLHALARHGFADLTGTDYCEAAVELARAVAHRAGLSHINFVVDDVLDSRLEGHYDLITDKGTFDAVKLHPEGRNHKKIYRKTVERLLASGGLLVITSCNNTHDELVSDMTGPCDRVELNGRAGLGKPDVIPQQSVLEYVDHVRTYPTFRFAGVEGSRVCTVAFRKKAVDHNS